MNITISNQPHQLPENCTIKEALTHLNMVTGSFAIAVNKTFIPKSDYSKTHLKENDTLEIVKPMQGG